MTLIYVLGVTFDSKITIEKHLRSVSRAASGRLGILRKSWRVCYDGSLLGRCFPGFVHQFCTVLQCSAYTPLTTGPCGQFARFLPGGVFECDITHHQSVVVLCVLCKIRCKPMHPLCSTCEHLPYVPVRVTRGALVVHRYILMHLLAAEPRCTAEPLLTSRCPCGTILLALYLTV